MRDLVRIVSVLFVGLAGSTPAQASSPEFSLSADAGYLYFSAATPFKGDAVYHGPAVSGTASMVWWLGRSRRIYGGVRLRGVYLLDTEHGEMTRFPGLMGDSSDTKKGPASGWATAWSLCAEVGGRYWWACGGAGLTHLEGTPTGWDANYDGVHNRPELVVGGGARVPIGDHLALRLGGELGTLIFNWRLEIQGGLELRF